MNLEVKTKWVEALRSGKYQQGAGALRARDNFCCLGVLCDIMEPSGWSEFDKHNNYQDMPSPSIIERAGIKDPTGASQYPPMVLTMMNDNGYNFDYIADWIEANL